MGFLLRMTRLWPVLLWSCLALVACAESGDGPRPAEPPQAEPPRAIASLIVEVDGKASRTIEVPGEPSSVYSLLLPEELATALTLSLADDSRSVQLLSANGTKTRVMVSTADGTRPVVQTEIYGRDAHIGPARPRQILRGLSKIIITTRVPEVAALPIYVQGRQLTLTADSLKGLPNVNWRGNRKQKSGVSACRLVDALKKVAPGRALARVILFAGESQRTLTGDQLAKELIALRATADDWKVKGFTEDGNLAWKFRGVTRIEIERVPKAGP